MSEPESGHYVVMWRAGPGGIWEIHPFLATEAESAVLSRQLLKQFGGEVYATRITLPC